MNFHKFNGCKQNHVILLSEVVTVDVIIVQHVKTEPQVGIISAITVVDKSTGEIMRSDAMARQAGSVVDLGRKSLQSAIDDSTERGEWQTLDTDEIFAVGTFSKLKEE
jgi:hypothetical protein